MSYSPHSRRTENTGFDCVRCGRTVGRHAGGSYRNHCRHCLWSQHVDQSPGDREARCQAPMQPVGIDHSGKKGYILIHRCTGCGAMDRNRLAPDDNMEVVIRLSQPPG